MMERTAEIAPDPMVDSPRTQRLRGIRVMLVVPTLGRGGAERQAFLVARELVRNEGASVRLVSLAPPGSPMTLIDACERDGVSWHAFTLIHKKGERLRQLWDLGRFALFLRREHPDVLLPYCMFPNVVSALTWKLGGARVCFWNQRDEGRDRVVRWVERLAVGRIRRFLSNSSHGGEFLTEALGVPREQIQIVHNGVEVSSAEHDAGWWRQRLGLPSTAFVACMVANLHGYKDHQTLITAWRLVVDRLRMDGRDAHLVLAGHGGDRQQAVLNQIAAENLGGHVHVIGSVSDVAGLLRSVDLAVFSSYNEGLPNSVLEAMSTGLAVVATDYPGIREAVGSAGASLLTRPRDPQDLADKIVLAAEDARLRGSIGRAGLMRVTSQFSVERMTDLMVDLIARELPDHSF
jgi:glycosyltransferase involved in cell wall biosynthesis